MDLMPAFLKLHWGVGPKVATNYEMPAGAREDSCALSTFTVVEIHVGSQMMDNDTHY